MEEIDIAAMYGAAENPVPQPTPSAASGPATVPARGIMNMPAMSAELRRLTAELDEQKRLVRRLTARLDHLENAVRGQRTAIREMEGDLANKIDLRD